MREQSDRVARLDCGRRRRARAPRGGAGASAAPRSAGLGPADGRRRAVGARRGRASRGRRADRVAALGGRGGVGVGATGTRGTSSSRSVNSRRRVRGPGAPGDGPSLRRPARGRRRDAFLGRAEGAVDGSDGQAPRGARSTNTNRRTTTSRDGPVPVRVIIWDRGQLRAGRPRAVARRDRARPRGVRAARGEAPRRLRAAAHRRGPRRSGC